MVSISPVFISEISKKIRFLSHRTRRAVYKRSWLLLALTTSVDDPIIYLHLYNDLDYLFFYFSRASNSKDSNELFLQSRKSLKTFLSLKRLCPIVSVML